MADNLMDLEITDQATIAYTSLGPEDRRLVDAWLDHLRNWRNDEFIRARSQRLASDQDIYVFQTSTGIVIAFTLAGNQVRVLSLFRKEALQAFAGRAE